MFKEEDIDFCFTCLEMRGQDKYASSDPESLVNDVFKIATKNGLDFEGENAIECYHWDAYNQILKWKNKGMKEFTFLRMTDKLMNKEKTWTDFVKFTQPMHRNSPQEDEKDYDDEEEEEDSFSDYEKESYEYYNLKCDYNLLLIIDKY
ncbi:beta-amylase [Tritrichomonas musculus]|uniref:Beta-amylase n=1 Tax=Tritrichomonas musculus TaxID=1915356 RepID=A0ABR2JQ54_9EUKA